MSSRSGFASSEGALEIELPDKEFFALYKSLQRRKTEPATMARDAKSYYSNRPRRNSQSVSHSTNSRSRVSGGGGAVQPMPRDREYDMSVASSSSDETSSYMTGYRSRLDVPGMPDKSYFTSGASKCDRRPEYIGHSCSNNAESSNGYVASNGHRTSNGHPVGNGYVAGNELVRYKSSQSQSPEDSDEEDNATLTPQDSISQVSSNRSMPNSYSNGARRPRQPSYAHYPTRLPPIGNQRSSSYSQGDYRSAYEAEQIYDRVRRYSVVERRPQGH